MTGPSLALDIQATQNPEYRDRGIGRFVTEHALALLDAGAPVAALLLNPTLPFPDGLHARLRQSSLLRWSTATTFGSLHDSVDVHHVMSPIEMTAPIETVLPPFVRDGGARLAVTLYDLIPLSDQAKYLGEGSARQRYVTRLEIVKAADHVLCISEFTRRQAVDLLGIDERRAVTIGAGVSPFFSPGTGFEERSTPNTRDYVMSVCGGDDRKNAEGLIDAFARLPSAIRSSHQLLIACDVSEPIAAMWRARARGAGLDDEDVVITGRVDDETLRDLYRNARLFVFPSRAEGFGLPLAEAAACAAPSISSNTTSIPEVLALPESTFDPDNVDAMTTAIARGLTDAPYRELLRATGLARAAVHRWGTVATRTLEAIDRPVAKPARGGPRARRLRVALVGPLPPVASGVADYTAHILGPLSRRVDLDVFATDGSDLEAARRAGAVRALPLSMLLRVAQPTSYDTLLYGVGNSSVHHEMLGPMMAAPGVLWMHDARLHGLYLSYALTHEDEPRAFLERLLTDTYGDAVPPELLGDRWFEHDVFTHSGIGLTRRLMRQATGVIVHSEAARDLLADDQPSDERLPTTRVIPLGIPEAPPVGAERDPNLLVSAGFCAPEKAPEVLIDALALLRQRRPVTLAFVGPADPETQRALVERATELGLGANVVFTGRLAEADYWAWLAKATCAVQLRRTNYGESSGAVNDCIAARTPAVTNVRSCQELADRGVVTMVGDELSAAAVASAVSGLLEDPLAVATARAAADSFAASHGFAAMADDIVDLLRDVADADPLRQGAMARQ